MRGRFGSGQVLSAFLFSGALLTGAVVAAYAQAAQTFSVHEVNFAIEGAPSTVRAGAPLTYNVTSEGFPHNLAIDGNGVELRPSTPNIQNGTGTVSFPALQPGTYNLYCPVGQHRQNGMEVRLTVVAGAAGLPALPLGLACAGLLSGAAGILWRRRGA